MLIISLVFELPKIFSLFLKQTQRIHNEDESTHASDKKLILGIEGLKMIQFLM